MPSYIITQPCLYATEDGSVVQHRKTGAVVELPAQVAAELGAAVQPLDAVLAEVPVPVAEPVDPTEPPRNRGKRRAADLGEVVDGG